MEHGHIHISSGALFLIVLLVLGIIGLVIYVIRSRQRDELRREEIELERERIAKGVAMPSRFPGPGSNRYASTPAASGTTMQQPQPAQGSYYGPMPMGGYPPGYNNDGLFIGLLMGEALAGGNRTTIIEENNGGSYSPPAPDNSPAPDAPSSGGIDFSWGDNSGSSSDGGSYDGGGSSDSGGGIDSSF